MRSLILADYIYEFEVPNSVFRYILHHDAAEYWTGDLPYPVKQEESIKGVIDDLEARVMAEHLNIATPLPKEHKPIVKTIDMLELMFFVREERMLGNTNHTRVWERANAALREHIPCIKIPQYKRQAIAAKDAIVMFKNG